MIDTATIGAELRGQIEAALATHDQEAFKTAGLESMACILRMWLEEAIPEIKQEVRRLKADNERLRDCLKAVEVMTRSGDGQCASVDVVHSVVASWLERAERGRDRSVTE